MSGILVIHCDFDTGNCDEKIDGFVPWITSARLTAMLEEMVRLQDILRAVTTKHSLLKGLSEYGPCKCHPGEPLCMKHGAADILNMIRTALE
ncbi:hypothetical protein LCGC14_1188220 [marine sediment metagenome]|uniref:Uncharacterized protein n=1 Tax=marine sediment metagenome TaxID=412755 RepID=A0A0F9P2Y9_9ZZZZ